MTEFGNFAKKEGAGRKMLFDIAVRASQLHDCLPSVFARTTILVCFDGTEQEVAQGVYDRLEQRYSLDAR